MNIHILKIPMSEMRYITAGDWYFDENGDLTIKVATDHRDFPTEDSQNLVAIHELVEVLLCQKRGITQKMVDDFDFGTEEYANEYDLEQGDMDGAPYRREHRFAMIVEHMMAHELGLTGYGVIK